MIMKKLSFLFILALLPLMASAQTLISGIYYNFNTDTKQATVVSGTTKYAGKVTIPATVTYGGVIYDVTSIGKEAFWKCTDLTSVIIPNSVTEIGGYAFSGCSSMKSASVGDGVITLGESSFYGCSSLTSVTIPDNVTSIGTGAFMNCTGLTSVTIPNSVKTLGQYVFYQCSGMTTMSIGSGISSIGMGAFGGNSNLAEVYCYAKVLPTLGTLIFYNTNIANARLYVPSASLNAYKNAAPWKEFGTIENLPGETPDTPEVSVIYYDYDDSSKQATVISGDTKYYGTVIIPETVLHNGVTYTVTKIDYRAFNYCSALTSVTIPNSVTSIGPNAFSSCTGLTSIIIPNSVTTIASDAFKNCTGLTSVTIGNSVEKINSYTFQGCSNLTSIIIPNSVTSIGQDAFLNCSKLMSVEIGDGVISIEKRAFGWCSSLTSVNIPQSVTSIGEEVFDGTSLTSIIIPDNVKTVGRNAFYYCKKLTSAIIGNGVTSIRESTFMGCEGLTSVIIGDSVKDIRENAFNGCSSLTSVTIPNSVSSIGGWDVFKNCKKLTSVTIGDSVKFIGAGSFNGCPVLESVYCYAEQVPTTVGEIFTGSNIENATLFVPETSADAYQTTEPWSGFGTIKTLSGDTPEIPETPKCATPTIAFVDGKVTFSCETEGVKFIYTIIPPSTTSGEGDNADFSTLYTIKVYAKKDGYMDSEVATKEVNVGGATGIKGDVNEDGTVNGTDIQEVINIIIGGE